VGSLTFVATRAREAGESRAQPGPSGVTARELGPGCNPARPWRRGGPSPPLLSPSASCEPTTRVSTPIAARSALALTWTRTLAIAQRRRVEKQHQASLIPAPPHGPSEPIPRPIRGSCHWIAHVLALATPRRARCRPLDQLLSQRSCSPSGEPAEQSTRDPR